jgi:hypothetical protein
MMRGSSTCMGMDSDGAWTWVTAVRSIIDRCGGWPCRQSVQLAYT